MEIKYIAKTETIEECVVASEKLKELFLYRTFDIKDRHLTIQRMEYDTEGSVLYAFFDVEFIQARDSDENYEPMTELEIGGI